MKYNKKNFLRSLAISCLMLNASVAATDKPYPNISIHDMAKKSNIPKPRRKSSSFTYSQAQFVNRNTNPEYSYSRNDSADTGGYYDNVLSDEETKVTNEDDLPPGYASNVSEWGLISLTNEDYEIDTIREYPNQESDADLSSCQSSPRKDSWQKYASKPQNPNKQRRFSTNPNMKPGLVKDRYNSRKKERNTQDRANYPKNTSKELKAITYPPKETSWKNTMYSLLALGSIIATAIFVFIISKKIMHHKR